MERRIDLSKLDLDVAAAAISERTVAWSAAGLTSRPLTWVDNDDEWPRPLRTNRRDVVRPMSVGLRVTAGRSELDVVLYAGGWADVGMVRLDSDDPLDATVSENYVEIESADEFGRLLDEFERSLP